MRAMWFQDRPIPAVAKNQSGAALKPGKGLIEGIAAAGIVTGGCAIEPHLYAGQLIGDCASPDIKCDTRNAPVGSERTCFNDQGGISTVRCEKTESGSAWAIIDSGTTINTGPDGSTPPQKKDGGKDAGPKPDVGDGPVTSPDLDGGPDASTPSDAGDSGKHDGSSGDAGQQDGGGHTPVVGAYCDDSDRGFNVNVAGTTESGETIDGVPQPPNRVERDRCINGRVVQEFGCSGAELVERPMPCSQDQACTGGACREVLPEPVLHLTFDEGTGETTFDQSSHGNDGTFSSSGVSWVPSGKISRAVSFDGNGAVTVRDNPSLVPVDEVTLVAWVRPAPITGVSAPAILGRVNEPPITGYSLGLLSYSPPATHPAGSVAPLSPPDPVTYIYDPNVNLQPDTWHHLVFVRDSSSYTLYANGVAGASREWGGVITTLPADVVIGLGYPRYSNNFTGQMDDIRVYMTALTPAQIAVLFNNGAGTEATRPPMP